MANISDAFLKVEVKHIFDMKKIKDKIELEAESGGSSICELSDIETDVESRTMRFDMSGRWSLELQFFHKISKECVTAEFYEAECGSDFYRGFSYNDGELEWESEGSYMSKEHMEALPEDSDFFWEELLSMSEEFMNKQEFEDNKEFQLQLEKYWNQYGGDLDELKADIVEYINQCQERLIKRQKDEGGIY